VIGAPPVRVPVKGAITTSIYVVVVRVPR